MTCDVTFINYDPLNYYNVVMQTPGATATITVPCLWKENSTVDRIR